MCRTRSWSSQLPRDISTRWRLCISDVSVHILTMTVPSCRLLLEPLRRIKEIVPDVVGFHCNFNGWPPVADKPELGMLKAFGCCAYAKNGALRSARMDEVENRMLKKCVAVA